MTAIIASVCINPRPASVQPMLIISLGGLPCLETLWLLDKEMTMKPKPMAPVSELLTHWQSAFCSGQTLCVLVMRQPICFPTDDGAIEPTDNTESKCE